MKEFVLASSSPRRKELLQSFGYTFKVIPSNITENQPTDLKPQQYVENLALEKVRDVFSRENTTCLAADTIVVLDGIILGKPTSIEENIAYLQKLSGRSHYVYTGYAVKTAQKEIYGFCATEVIFNDLSQEFILDYVNKGLGLDKAGGYGIQDGQLVKEYIGSYTNVIGLPMEKINQILKELL